MLILSLKRPAITAKILLSIISIAQGCVRTLEQTITIHFAYVAHTGHAS